MQRRTLISAAVGGALINAAGWRLSRPDAAAAQLTRGTATPDGFHLYTGSDLAFGTTMSIQVLHDNRRQAELAIEDAFQAAKDVDALMSIYSPRSQVYQLNRDGRLAAPDARLLHVMQDAMRLSALSAGAFDMTVQPLWQQFSQAAKNRTLPEPAALRAARALVNWRDVSIGADEIRLRQPGMAITLNGIAQGYAVDLALAALKARGVRHALLDTGEFISVGRKPANRHWAIGVQNPRDTQALTAVLEMDGRSIATSGDYETTFTPDFRHHHIFDPATGDSPLQLASVTVAAPTGLQADGLSTALFVMGSAKALRLAASLPRVDVLLVSKQGQVWSSAGLRQRQG
ncbi:MULTISPECIES: FAD:protein FMN transferase [unclassified Herbaspirillum]|uniref:FAD:protein FMN transferase n=1 Tax=unclassified Herbaspirillum TaxID=2624150 RepID=UPI0011538E0E|nr:MULTISPECIES: FAD:protein FMN transferase [unclassified Herbaspirillum]MBB5393130.1 thiamine biosynthesis lipoprotein [Herbaspirillum sp. SJZ102]TQK04228.1 thiamine biosynthesis lipoprotein [Herbaspirillum sp. SJZ130]TQK09987.1 thiamine biosynthesis lipoprotein [Herbaspirillum sp. SJZ106]